MAGRPILWRIYVPPVTIRVIPENEIPPAWRVDIYFIMLILKKRPEYVILK